MHCEIERCWVGCFGNGCWLLLVHFKCCCYLPNDRTKTYLYASQLSLIVLRLAADVFSLLPKQQDHSADKSKLKTRRLCGKVFASSSMTMSQ